jgi:hypothetical protein
MVQNNSAGGETAAKLKANLAFAPGLKNNPRVCL